jgi:acylphosphatase
MACRRYLISGRVQGVWFRASTREQALRLGLSGRADNLPDGRVRVEACGAADALDALQGWLWRGPELARVDSVEVTDMPDQAFDGFSTGRHEGG